MQKIVRRFMRLAAIVGLTAATARGQSVIGFKLEDAGGTIHALARQPDGKLLIGGGGFTMVNGEPRIGLARLNTDGSLDYGFRSDINFGSNVFAIAVHATNIYVAGDFTTIGGRSANRIARLRMSDGAPDPGFTNAAVNTIYALLAVGSNLYVAGEATLFNGTGRRITRLGIADGAVDSGFTNSANGTVTVLQSDGTNLFIGGKFATFNGQNRSRLAKLNLLNNTLDPVFTNGASSFVYALALDGSDLYVGGEFLTIGGQSRRHLARLNAGDGLADPAFNGNVNGTGTVYAILHDGTNLYIGGLFTNLAGQTRERLARLNPGNGAPQAGFTNGVNGAVRALALEATGLLVGGAFDDIGGVEAFGVARCDRETGAADPTWRGRTTALGAAVVRALALGSDGRVAVGGNFRFVDGVSRRNLALLGADGMVDPVFTNGVNAAVRALVWNGTHLYAGGDFTAVGGAARRYLAKLRTTDGAADTAFTNGVNNAVYALAADDNHLYAGGLFSGYIGKFSLNDGAAVTSFATANSNVYALALSGTNLFVGGDFSVIGGAARERVARLSAYDGAHNSNFNGAANGSVYALATSGEYLFLGGDFTLVGTNMLSRRCLAKLNKQHGAVLTDFTNGANAAVHALVLDAAGLYIAGNYTNIGGVARGGLARLSFSDGAVDAAFTNGTDGQVKALAVNGPHVYAGGGFGAAGGAAASRLALFGWPVAAAIQPAPGDGRQVTIWGAPGGTYVLQGAANLASGWSDLATNSSSGDACVMTVTNSTPVSFYRAREP